MRPEELVGFSIAHQPLSVFSHFHDFYELALVLRGTGQHVTVARQPAGPPGQRRSSSLPGSATATRCATTWSSTTASCASRPPGSTSRGRSATRGSGGCSRLPATCRGCPSWSTLDEDAFDGVPRRTSTPSGSGRAADRSEALRPRPPAAGARRPGPRARGRSSRTRCAAEPGCPGGRRRPPSACSSRTCGVTGRSRSWPSELCVGAVPPGAAVQALGRPAARSRTPTVAAPSARPSCCRRPTTRSPTIGAEVGWPDPSHFSRRFRQELGVEPARLPRPAAGDHRGSEPAALRLSRGRRCRRRGADPGVRRVGHASAGLDDPCVASPRPRGGPVPATAGPSPCAPSTSPAMRPSPGPRTSPVVPKGSSTSALEAPRVVDAPVDGHRAVGALDRGPRPVDARRRARGARSTWR